MVVGLLSRFARGKVGGDEKHVKTGKQTIKDRLLRLMLRSDSNNK